LNTSRRVHTLTVLADGRVLAAGGVHGNPADKPFVTATAEIYDPATGAWTDTGSMHLSRSNHSATLLPDGRVLVAGGATDQPPLPMEVVTNTAEIYDPATGMWTQAAPMIFARATFSAVLLPDGQVMVVSGAIETGGDLAGLTFCESYDPATGTWTFLDPIGTGVPLETGKPRVNAIAVGLDDGSVLVVGGHQGGPMNRSFSPFSMSSVERFDSTTKKWAPTGSMRIPRDEHRVVKLDSGQVLAIGGLEYGGHDAGYQNSEIYDPATGQWGPLIGLSIGRAKFGAVKLADGRVLIAGGAAVLAAASPTGHHVLITDTDVFTP
jgi:hypothetical protein